MKANEKMLLDKLFENVKEVLKAKDAPADVKAQAEALMAQAKKVK